MVIGKQSTTERRDEMESVLPPQSSLFSYNITSVTSRNNERKKRKRMKSWRKNERVHVLTADDVALMVQVSVPHVQQQVRAVWVWSLCSTRPTRWSPVHAARPVLVQIQVSYTIDHAESANTHSVICSNDTDTRARGRSLITLRSGVTELGLLRTRLYLMGVLCVMYNDRTDWGGGVDQVCACMCVYKCVCVMALCDLWLMYLLFIF